MSEFAIHGRFRHGRRFFRQILENAKGQVEFSPVVESSKFITKQRPILFEGDVMHCNKIHRLKPVFLVRLIGWSLDFSKFGARIVKPKVWWRSAVETSAQRLANVCYTFNNRLAPNEADWLKTILEQSVKPIIVMAVYCPEQPFET